MKKLLIGMMVAAQVTVFAKLSLAQQNGWNQQSKNETFIMRPRTSGLLSGTLIINSDGTETYLMPSLLTTPEGSEDVDYFIVTNPTSEE